MEYWKILIIAIVGPLLIWRLREPLTKRRKLWSYKGLRQSACPAKFAKSSNHNTLRQFERNKTTKAFWSSQTGITWYNWGMNNEPLHDAIIARIIELYEQGGGIFDIYDRLDERVSLDDISATLDDYDASDADFDLEGFCD